MELLVHIWSLFIRIARFFSQSVAPFIPLPPPAFEGIPRAVSYAITSCLFFPPSLIKRMAQSVVEVMEDAKGKVQENLLANGGRSPECPYPCFPSSFIIIHQWPQPWPSSVGRCETAPLRAWWHHCLEDRALYKFIIPLSHFWSLWPFLPVAELRSEIRNESGFEGVSWLVGPPTFSLSLWSLPHGIFHLCPQMRLKKKCLHCWECLKMNSLVVSSKLDPNHLV